MKKHISYPKIQQFRNVVATINREATFVGLDGEGNAIYNEAAKKPIISFEGTIKLHGTNAGVSYNSQDGIWVQSRENIITIEKDNAGFAFFVESKKKYFEHIIIDHICRINNIDPDEFTITIYGEWAGVGIQKGVGISELPKRFYIFGVKISKPQDESFNAYWVDSYDIRCEEADIYNIMDFGTYYLGIDFNNPKQYQNALVKITSEIEAECPVAKHFGVSGIGEGVVWSANYNGVVHRFKVKGEKHSSSKVKKLASVDVERLNTIQEFVDSVVTENRFNQALGVVFNGEPLDIKKTGDLMKWIVNDVISEEMDTMISNGFEPKDVNKHISAKAREMFFEKLNNDI